MTEAVQLPVRSDANAAKPRRSRSRSASPKRSVGAEPRLRSPSREEVKATLKKNVKTKEWRDLYAAAGKTWVADLATDEERAWVVRRLDRHKTFEPLDHMGPGALEEATLRWVKSKNTPAADLVKVRDKLNQRMPLPKPPPPPPPPPPLELLKPTLDSQERVLEAFQAVSAAASKLGVALPNVNIVVPAPPTDELKEKLAQAQRQHERDLRQRPLTADGQRRRPQRDRISEGLINSGYYKKGDRVQATLRDGTLCYGTVREVRTVFIRVDWEPGVRPQHPNPRASSPWLCKIVEGKPVPKLSSSSSSSSSAASPASSSSSASSVPASSAAPSNEKDPQWRTPTKERVQELDELVARLTPESKQRVRDGWKLMMQCNEMDDDGWADLWNCDSKEVRAHHGLTLAELNTTDFGRALQAANAHNYMNEQPLRPLSLWSTSS